MSKWKDSDLELFREAVRDVRRLNSSTHSIERPKPAPKARFMRADQREVLRESLLPVADPALLETGDELSFKRDGIPDTVLRKLRRGEYVVDAELDLHGMNATDARTAMKDFLLDALSARKRCIRIVHGKGRRSGPKGPVLKNLVNRWLRQVDAVIAFGSARPNDGGSGAVYVLLRS
jgi:DNA-nicking Smr family endonuclease